MQVTEFSKRRSFTKEQKLSILQELRGGHLNHSDLARKHGIHPVTIYNWKRDMRKDQSQNSITMDSLLLEIEELKKKNTHLKSAVADLTIDKEILKCANDVLKKAQIKKELKQQKK